MRCDILCAAGGTEAVVAASNPGIITHNIWGNDLVGQVNRNVSTLNRYYYLKDHLGSIHVTVNSSGTVVGHDDYDPWGMILEGRSAVSTADARYRFTEKERDTETGHYWFGARAYEPRIGRWLTVDPLVEKYPAWSPYTYVMNNPIRMFDPDGKYVVDGTRATRYTMSNAVAITLMEQMPYANVVFMGERQFRGDPSFSPNLGDWTVAAASFGLGKLLSTVTKSLTGLDRAIMKGFEITTTAGEVAMAARLLGMETLKNLSIDEAVFNKALESGLAVKAKVLREAMVFKGYGERVTKMVEVESETQIMLNPNAKVPKGKTPEQFFREELRIIREQTEKEYDK